MMGFARSTYYDEPAKVADDTELVVAMHAIKDEFEAYGWRRMQAALAQQGWKVNHKKIKRLLREHGLNARTRGRWVSTTDSDHDSPIFSNLARDLVVAGPNVLWVADLTYINISGGFVYAALIMDAWSRRIVGCALGQRIDVRLTLAALDAAVALRRPPEAAFIIQTAARNMLLRSIATASLKPGSSAPWGAAAIPTITPRWKA